MVEFASPWDEQLYNSAVPGLFTLDPAGRLRVDPERTREGYLLIGTPEKHDPGHWVFTDRVTKLRLYALVTHPALAECQPRADVVRYAEAEAAMAEADAQWVRVAEREEE